MRLSLARVIVRKTDLRRVAAAATLRNGRFTLSIGEAQFHGGTLRGRAVFSQAEDGNADVKIEASIAEFDLAAGMPVLTGIQRIEGKGTLALALEGTGAHVQAITRSLSGSVTFSAKDGALSGINVEQVLRRLERKPLSGSPDFGGGRTAFERMNAKLRVAGGFAKVEDANIEGPIVKVRLAGEASVVDRDFDLKGVATLMRAATPAASVFELPFIVLGPWDRPFLLPDATALIQRSGAAAPLLDAARKQAAREKTGNAKNETSAPPIEPQ
jgi:AsmA protein